MNKKTSILIVNFNTSDFIDVALYAISKLTKYPYTVYILDNGSKRAEYNKLKRICNHYEHVSLERWNTSLRGSLAHGTALNYLVKKVDTPFFSILDADAVWLIKDWDETLMKRITKKVKVIGTQAPPMKYQDFPLMFAIFFESRTFMNLEVDFRPVNINQHVDTGYDLREKYGMKGYRGEVITCYNSSKYQKGPFRSLLVGEYYLEGINPIFASHFGRGATLGGEKYVRSSIPILKGYLAYLEGKKEKRRWISICRKIIDDQTNKKAIIV